MSRIDDERLGLGWEVWFLLAILAVGGIIGLLIPTIIGAGLEQAGARPMPEGNVTLDWRRVVGGVSAAAVFAILAIRIFRTTDWQNT